MSLAILQFILARITYRTWDFVTGPMGDGFFLQVRFYATDNDGDFGGVLSEQKGRKLYISKFMTEGEVIQTALGAILAAEEHEARENFKVDGVAIFGPHLDINALTRIAKNPVMRERVVA